MAENLLQYAAMTPNLAARGVVETFVREHPLFDSLRFMDIGEQFNWPYNREASLGGVGFRAINGDYDAAAKTSGVINPMVETTSPLGGVVTVDRLKDTPAYRAARVQGKAKAAARFYARNFIKGAKSSDPRGFDGLYTRIAAANITYAGTNGGQLVLKALDDLLASIPGRNSEKVLIMGDLMVTTLGATLRAEGATTIGLAEWQGMHTPLAYNGARIIPAGDDESGSQILAFNETRGNSQVTGSIIVARMGEADEEWVQGIARRAASGVFEVEDHGVRGVSREILVEGLAGVGVFHGKAAYRYAGILTFAR
jgi:hypothetical protein